MVPTVLCGLVTDALEIYNLRLYLWSDMKSFENKKKTKWFYGFLMTCYLWTKLCVFL